MRSNHGRMLHLSIAVLATISCGCHALNKKERAIQIPIASSEELNRPTVSIGGIVKNPQELVIPATGLKLLSAISQAAVDLTAVDSGGEVLFSQEDMFVVLSRPTALGPQIHYMPLSLVRYTMAGDIRLENNDVIQLISVDELVAVSADQLPGLTDQFIVNGLVQRPGLYTIAKGDPDDPGSGSKNEFKDIVNDNYPGTRREPTVNMAVLTRRSLTGLGTQNYLIPVGMAAPEFGAPELENMKIAAGDIINFTRFERVPIILGGLVGNVSEATRVEAKQQLRRLHALRQNQPKKRNWTARIPDSLRLRR